MYNRCVMTTSKTMLNIKIDAKLKKEAQKLAESFGLPLSTIITRKLKEFVEEREITFRESYKVNKKTEEELLKMSEEIKKGDMTNFVGPFDSVDEFIKDLTS